MYVKLCDSIREDLGCLLYTLKREVVGCMFGRPPYQFMSLHVQLYTLITYAIRLVAILIAKIDQLSCMLTAGHRLVKSLG